MRYCDLCEFQYPEEQMTRKNVFGLYVGYYCEGCL
jgi:hypothetical protein